MHLKLQQHQMHPAGPHKHARGGGSPVLDSHHGLRSPENRWREPRHPTVVVRAEYRPPPHSSEDANPRMEAQARMWARVARSRNSGHEFNTDLPAEWPIEEGTALLDPLLRSGVRLSRCF